LEWAANFQPQDFNPATFSARRLPDRVHYEMVRCRSCGLVRSDPVADEDTLAALYNSSALTYGEEAGELSTTYGKYLDRAARHCRETRSLLEVGCGNGFFLEEALRRGFTEVAGVEPGKSMVASAGPAVRDKIKCVTMRPGLFPPESFDVVCFFQVMDHLADPLAALREARALVRPGGVVLILNHNVESFSARLLGEKSPIVDIEHTFLYSPDTLSKLANRAGMQVLDIGPVFNFYRARYIARLLPMSAPLKTRILAALDFSPLGKLKLWLPLGNLFVVARRETRNVGGADLQNA
jgi:SAM-dependent methyltransferase